MEDYRHHVSGFFATIEDAERARSGLIALGFPDDQLQILRSADARLSDAPLADSNEVLKNIVVEGTIGTAIGTGLGALAEIALAATNVSLFVASPLIGPLAMLGWGASIGGLLGAATGSVAATGTKKRRFSDLVGDAILSGQVVLLAKTRTARQTMIAREVIGEAIGAQSGADVH